MVVAFLRCVIGENRRTVPAVPTIQYWLEGFVVKPSVADFLVALCCAPAGQTPEKQQTFPIVIGAPFINPNLSVDEVLGQFKKSLKEIVAKTLS